jgi:hypothetical protein
MISIRLAHHTTSYKVASLALVFFPRPPDPKGQKDQNQEEDDYPDDESPICFLGTMVNLITSKMWEKSPLIEFRKGFFELLNEF